MSGEPRSYQKLYFDPDLHPDNTLKAFEDFIQLFQLRYDAQYPDPPKVSRDSAIQRWKYENTTTDVTDPKPTLVQYDQIIEDWKSKDKIAKLLGIFSSNRLYLHWCNAEPVEIQQKQEKWEGFLTKMKTFVSTYRKYNITEFSLQ